MGYKLLKLDVVSVNKMLSLMFSNAGVYIDFFISLNMFMSNL